MRYLAERVYGVLKSLYGEAQVFLGLAEGDSLPDSYCVYNIPTGHELYPSTTSRTIDAVWVYDVYVDVYSIAAETVMTRLREIQDHFAAMEDTKSGEQIIHVINPACDFELDAEKDTQGRNVYRGTFRCEAWTATGDQYSSSSSTTSSASASSSSTTSSASASSASSSSHSPSSSSHSPSSSSHSPSSASSSSSSTAQESSGSSSSPQTSSYSSESSTSSESSGP